MADSLLAFAQSVKVSRVAFGIPPVSFSSAGDRPQNPRRPRKYRSVRDYFTRYVKAHKPSIAPRLRLAEDIGRWFDCLGPTAAPAGWRKDGHIGDAPALIGASGRIVRPYAQSNPATGGKTWGWQARVIRPQSIAEHGRLVWRGRCRPAPDLT